MRWIKRFKYAPSHILAPLVQAPAPRACARLICCTYVGVYVVRRSHLFEHRSAGGADGDSRRLLPGCIDIAVLLPGYSDDAAIGRPSPASARRDNLGVRQQLQEPYAEAAHVRESREKLAEM
jgi:hypothetical protein